MGWMNRRVHQQQKMIPTDNLLKSRITACMMNWCDMSNTQLNADFRSVLRLVSRDNLS